VSLEMLSKDSHLSLVSGGASYCDPVCVLCVAGYLFLLGFFGYAFLLERVFPHACCAALFFYLVFGRYRSMGKCG